MLRGEIRQDFGHFKPKCTYRREMLNDSRRPDTVNNGLHLLSLCKHDCYLIVNMSSNALHDT